MRITGEVSDAALAAYFAAADVYLSLSVHEGFGVPLVEAMAAGVPVVARGVGAVAETVGDAALLLAGTTRPTWPRRCTGSAPTTRCAAGWSRRGGAAAADALPAMLSARSWWPPSPRWRGAPR